MALKISIIIPSFNVEKYIERCLLSVTKQDLSSSDYEVIVIDDGSADRTLELMTVVAESYPNIQIISKKYEGVSEARNRGIALAKGEYILFIDSDDSIVENCLGTLYKKAREEQLDILECDFINVNEEGSRLNYRIPTRKGRFAAGEIIDGREYLLSQKKVLPMVWMRLYRRDFLIENDLKMVPIRHEDEEFIPRTIYLAQRIGYLPLSFYRYLTREGSITTAYRDQNYFDMITAMGNLNQFIEERISLNDPKLIRFFNRHIAQILLMIFKRSIRDQRPFQGEMIAEMKRRNIYPLKSTQLKFYVILMNFSWQSFIKYYQFKLKISGK